MFCTFRQDDDACIGDEPKDEFVCRADQCRTAASRILSSMNWRTDPCRDFYKFACGGWSPGTGAGRRNTSSRYGQTPELSFSNLQKNVDQQIQGKFCIAAVIQRGSSQIPKTEVQMSIELSPGGISDLKICPWNSFLI